MSLKTSYLGLELEHPLVASASPLSYSLEGIRQLEDGGASAVVMHSLFEEQIEQEGKVLDHFLHYGTFSHFEALDYFPEPEQFNLGSEDYVELVRSAKAAVDIPVIPSLNGITDHGWLRYAKYLEDAGADALELNLYHLVTDPELSATEIEERYLHILGSVRESIKIPVAVKVGPYFSSFAHMAKLFAKQGANGLVLFNRFYQPDFDLETLDVKANLVLSNSHDLRLPLTWIAILYGRVPVDFALTSGVHSHFDVLKGLMAGASVTMMASEPLRNGVARFREIQDALIQWMDDHDYDSVTQMKGSMSQLNVANPEAFERANYMKVLQSWRQDPTGVLSR
ncbi:MAG: dihydroorotate dehydrogenase-like protein [Trueperaceae bacterium]|nr:dihydroorotate dehydrogenase-like protein [Trueperaceae bacterium]